jgi:hypothetical protein
MGTPIKKEKTRNPHMPKPEEVEEHGSFTSISSVPLPKLNYKMHFRNMDMGKRGGNQEGKSEKRVHSFAPFKYEESCNHMAFIYLDCKGVCAARIVATSFCCSLWYFGFLSSRCFPRG